MITIIKEFSKPVYQHLLPVLDTNDVMHGIVSIPVTQFTHDKQEIVIGQRKLAITAVQFVDSEGSFKKQLACLVFPATNTTGAWNGLQGWIPVSKFQIMRYWAIPVANPGYLRETMGLVNIFLNNEFDDSEVTVTAPSNTQTSDNKQIILSAKLNVSKARLAKKLDCIEFNWVKVFEQVACKHHCDLKPVTIETLQAPPVFKVICFTKSTSDGIPEFMRILALNTPINSSYSFVFNINEHVLFNVTLNLK